MAKTLTPTQREANIRQNKDSGTLHLFGYRLFSGPGIIPTARPLLQGASAPMVRAASKMVLPLIASGPVAQR